MTDTEGKTFYEWLLIWCERHPDRSKATHRGFLEEDGSFDPSRRYTETEFMERFALYHNVEP